MKTSGTTELARALIQAELLRPEDIKNTILMLLAVMDGLTDVVLSGDQWSLATYWAKDTCLRSGMAEKEFDRVAKKFNEYRVARKRQNPIAGMFDKE